MFYGLHVLFSHQLVLLLVSLAHFMVFLYFSSHTLLLHDTLPVLDLMRMFSQEVLLNILPFSFLAHGQRCLDNLPAEARPVLLLRLLDHSLNIGIVLPTVAEILHHSPLWGNGWRVYASVALVKLCLILRGHILERAGLRGVHELRPHLYGRGSI